MVLVVAAMAAFWIALTQSWRLNTNLAKFVLAYRVNKRGDLSPQYSPCVFLVRGAPSFVDGFCHLEADSGGVYVASWAMPYLYVPWDDLEIAGEKRIFLRKYQEVRVSLIPGFSWCVPPTRLNIEKHAAK